MFMKILPRRVSKVGIRVRHYKLDFEKELHEIQMRTLVAVFTNHRSFGPALPWLPIPETSFGIPFGLVFLYF